jgi:dephospho-CoA kinase
MTFRLGLTGSIGMGKSTTAAMFAAEGIPVWDADATVHALYAPDGAATAHVLALFPDTRAPDGAVSRAALRARIAADSTVLDRLTAFVHPLVAASRDQFLASHAATPIVLLDIPLLYENHLDALCDGVVVVSTTPQEQRRRLQARAQMTEAEVDLILSRQMPDAEKRARATWIIETTTLESARAQVKKVLADIRGSLNHA